LFRGLTLSILNQGAKEEMDMLSEKVVRDLQITRGWTREFIAVLTPYYVATLTHLSKGHAGPIYRIIDEMWHTHILRTRDYADFCAANFGGFIHHETLHEPSESAPPQQSADFFRDYGLSVEGLAGVCGRKLEPAKCETPPRVGTDRATFALEVARCEPPAPPTTPAIDAILQTALVIAACKPGGETEPTVQPPALARCEQPDEPVPPKLMTPKSMTPKLMTPKLMTPKPMTALRGELL
jgi:hypothetical protein